MSVTAGPMGITRWRRCSPLPGWGPDHGHARRAGQFRDRRAVRGRSGERGRQSGDPRARPFPRTGRARAAGRHHPDQGAADRVGHRRRFGGCSGDVARPGAACGCVGRGGHACRDCAWRGRTGLRIGAHQPGCRPGRRIGRSGRVDRHSAAAGQSAGGGVDRRSLCRVGRGRSGGAGDGRSDGGRPGRAQRPAAGGACGGTGDRCGAGDAGGATGVRLARMSGSGATCFALFDDGAQREAADRTIAAAQRGWWRLASRLA